MQAVWKVKAAKHAFDRLNFRFRYTRLSCFEIISIFLELFISWRHSSQLGDLRVSDVCEGVTTLELRARLG
jgi:hypothetical protein